MDWTFKKGSFDFIHSRDLMLCIRNWPRLATQCYEHLKPGGYIELQCINTRLHCDDGTSPEDSAMEKFVQVGLQATTQMGMPGTDPEKYSDL
jgi:hypothetical protein